MTELLQNIWIIFKWFFFDIVPMLVTVPLGALGELLDTIDFIYWLIGIIPIVVGALIHYIKKHT